MFLSNCAVCGKESQGSLKIKKIIKQYSTILIIFEMISLKWIKFLIEMEIEFKIWINHKAPKFNVGDRVRII